LNSYEIISQWILNPACLPIPTYRTKNLNLEMPDIKYHKMIFYITDVESAETGAFLVPLNVT